MEVIITALGPDNVGLADPIIHHVTGRGARIAEIQKQTDLVELRTIH